MHGVHQTFISALSNMGANSYHFAAGQGKELGNLENNIVQQKCSEAASVEGRPIAMMAARCSDVLWIRSSFSLIFFAIAASGTRNGTFFSSPLYQPSFRLATFPMQWLFWLQNGVHFLGSLRFSVSGSGRNIDVFRS